VEDTPEDTLQNGLEDILKGTSGGVVRRIHQNGLLQGTLPNLFIYEYLLQFPLKNLKNIYLGY
jgi:hypothetical protein